MCPRRLGEDYLGVEGSRSSSRKLGYGHLSCEEARCRIVLGKARP